MKDNEGFLVLLAELIGLRYYKDRYSYDNYEDTPFCSNLLH